MHTSIGSKTVERLRRFTEALENGEPILENFNYRKFKLDLDPQPYDPELVKETRVSLKLSQALFSQFLGVSVKTVQSWEQGTNTPNDMACRFMDEIRRDPGFWLKRIADSIQVTESVP
ncbi:MAG TPA: transcriptional regulator [Gimesia maris]|uniref:Transcriptional regulator n=1 Tax=Gimesia maris TaxID=122 RepID=A0A3D3R123_9PLAN|nr:transcriptional regulator [Gimesia maris]